MRIPRMRASMAAAALLVAGCTTGALTADTQDVIDPTKVNNVNGLTALRAGAIGDFAYSNAGDQGNQEGQILVSGLVADEFRNSDTFPTRQEMDNLQMRVENVSLDGVYRALHRARVSTQEAGRRFREIGPAGAVTTNAIAELESLSGFALIYFGENYCGNVPLGRFTSDSVQNGTSNTTTQLFQAAIAKFDSALVVRPGYGLAAVGRARALLNLGQFAAAATAVNAVPTSFSYVETHAILPSRIVNGVYTFFVESVRWSMANGEGTNGLNYIAAADPRVPSEDTGDTGFDGFTPQVNQTKYPGRDASIVIADGREARLIQAEAALQSGAPGAWLTILNTLRAANTPALPALVDPGTAAGRITLHFRERAFWMYATGHRLGDMRRLLRAPYSRARNTVFPIGPYPKGDNYGLQVNIPVSFSETNNPNYDPAACSATTP